MKCQVKIISIVISAMCLHQALCEPPKPKYHPKPLVWPSKNWPPNRGSAMIRSNGMMVRLRGSGSSNVASRVPPPGPGMFIKSAAPIRFAIPMRSNPNNRQKAPLTASPSNHVFFNGGGQRPYASQLTASQNAFKFSSPAQKTAIKFQMPPPMKKKPEFIYEKVHVPKYADPVRYNVGSDGAIHTIPAPNLGGKDPSPIPEIAYNTINNQLDSDLAKFPAVFSLEKPGHQYQVRESYNDFLNKNVQKTYYAPDNDPTVQTHAVQPVDDPLSIPSNGLQKPSDVLLYQQNIQYGASPLVQSSHYSVEPFGFPVTSQPQLQQYHLQQNTMMKQGMFPSLNPTYLVMQSNNLLGQHQQHQQPQLFRPEHGYIDTSVTSQPYNSFDYTQPQQVASFGQIFSAQQDQAHLESTSTQVPTTISNFHHDASASQETPSYSQILEPKPSNYQYSPQNYVDLPEEHLSQNDIQNLLYNDLYQDYVNHRQFENDQILREATQELHEKQKIQQQQTETAYNLHQLVQKEKYNPLRIIVPDEDQQFKKRMDDEETVYDDEYDESSEEVQSETGKSKSS